MTAPKSITQIVRGDAHLTSLIRSDNFVRDPRCEAIADAVRGLSPLDEHCLLGFLMGYKACDREFLTAIEEWLESNRAMNARIAQRLR